MPVAVQIALSSLIACAFAKPSLEFMIVSDLIHSFLKPELSSLASLGVLVVIRTMISFFLGRELESAAESKEHILAA